MRQIDAIMASLATNGDLFVPDIDKLLHPGGGDGSSSGKQFDDWVRANFVKASPLSVSRNSPVKKRITH